jgi:asparagine synthase (glutamine-hydrolysing)
VILGLWDRTASPGELGAELRGGLARIGYNDGVLATSWHNNHVAFAWLPVDTDASQDAGQPFTTRAGSTVSIYEGKLYNHAELKALSKDFSDRDQAHSGDAFGYLYERYGENFLDRINGKFSLALWDEKNQRLLLGRDRLGIESLYYLRLGNRIVFSSSLRALLVIWWVKKQLNYEAILQYLLYCYNPADDTFFEGVRKLPAAHLLSLDSSGTCLKRYWNLSFSGAVVKSENAYREEILGLIEDAIRIRFDDDQAPGILLSGGTDSSTIVHFASKISKKPLRTFSFRCEGRSFDESYYARLIAQRYGTEHTEILYEVDHLKTIEKAIHSMDEPFCDIGIELATYLLGQAAQGKVSYIFSGEGGDELFGGHPVYIADKFAALVDRVPRGVTAPFLTLLQKLPDSDQKKNFQVKLKRFAYSLSFPPELLSHRWRVYYKPDEIQTLCTGEFLASCDLSRLYDRMLRYNKLPDGSELLSRSLYSDYHTLVDFYLRRLGLLRGFSIDSRLPLLDYRLVEYAAQIPSKMKIRGLSNTKFIYKKILEGTLPREILYDRPKLGHSVPMKNWLRENGKVRNWMEDILSESSIAKRGFFRSSMVRRLWDGHLTMRHNFSHRLWALVVLELWLRMWSDSQPPAIVGRSAQLSKGSATLVA